MFQVREQKKNTFAKEKSESWGNIKRFKLNWEQEQP